MKIERLQALMARAGLDAVVVTSPESTLYLSEAFVMTQELIRERIAVVLVPREGRPLSIVSRMEEVLVRRLSALPDCSTYTYVEFGDPSDAGAPIPMAVEQLHTWRCERGTIGIEDGFLPVELHKVLTVGLPHARFVDAGGILAETRWVKTPDEITRLTAAARATESAIWEAFGAGDAGWTEKQLADRIASNLLANGADTVAYVFLGAGECGSMSHWMPAATPIRAGDVVKVDAMARFGGYCSDFARTVIAGRPSDRQTQIYRALVRSQRRLLNSVKPAMPVSELYRTAGALMQDEGLPFRSLHIGHGIGVQLHERPMIAPWASETLENGMILNVEIFYRDGEAAGYHLEDLVHIMASGAEVITTPMEDEELPALGRPLAPARR